MAAFTASVHSMHPTPEISAIDIVFFSAYWHDIDGNAVRSMG